MDDTGNEQRLQKLAEAVIAARQAKGWEDHSLARRSKLSYATVLQLEEGHPYFALPDSDRVTHAVEEALGWERGSISAFIKNGTPLTPADEPPTPATGAGESRP